MNKKAELVVGIQKEGGSEWTPFRGLAFAFNCNLPVSARWLFLYYLWHADDEGLIDASNAEIAARTQLTSKNTVRKYTRLLIKEGLLERVQEGGSLEGSHVHRLKEFSGWPEGGEV